MRSKPRKPDTTGPAQGPVSKARVSIHKKKATVSTPISRVVEEICQEIEADLTDKEIQSFPWEWILFATEYCKLKSKAILRNSGNVGSKAIKRK